MILETGMRCWTSWDACVRNVVELMKSVAWQKKYTLPPIIMEVENGPQKETSKSSCLGPHFPLNHDYGRKGTLQKTNAWNLKNHPLWKWKKNLNQSFIFGFSIFVFFWGECNASSFLFLLRPANVFFGVWNPLQIWWVPLGLRRSQKHNETMKQQNAN